MALDVPLSVKLIAAEDITSINQSIPAEYREQVIDLLVTSIQTTFLFGLGCAIAAAITVYFVPWGKIKTALQRDLGPTAQDGSLPL